jgi:branched-chain amino acid transport system ATP-binding protein|tara:strand:+ start:546 stop:1232 length:687 start_codon:yes stop_codon:yes gene_type:complete
MTLLKLQNVAASYGASKALFDVNLSLSEGEVLALLGRNGMGKSTTVKTICRMMSATGTLTFDNQDLHRLACHKVARLGIGLVPEGRRCFANLTVTENLIAAARPGPWDLARVITLFSQLGARKAQRANTLSGGEQQMLAIGRALMTNPRLLILDEATEGLAPIIRQEIWAVISKLKADTGMAIIVIDKSLAELKQVCDRAAIIERGKTVWQGAMVDLTPNISERLIGV